MIDPGSSILTPWTTFYTMTGAAAATLMGLMFIVITLVMSDRERSTQDGIGTFTTPTVVHFGAALLISIILVAPWHRLLPCAIIFIVMGFCGVGNILRLMVKTQRIDYDPDIEDWAWYTILPLLAYGLIFAAGSALPFIPPTAVIGFAVGVVLFIFIGIHNAWDIVTYIATHRNEPD